MKSICNKNFYNFLDFLFYRFYLMVRCIGVVKDWLVYYDV